jgi:hypothetical protein
MSKSNRSTTQAHDAQVIAGIQKDLHAASSLPLGGTTFTPATLTQLVQSRIDAASGVANARAVWLDAAAKYKVLSAQVSLVVNGLRQYVVNAFGADSPVLADFGFTPRKKAVLTTEQKVARAQKAKATRAARGTKGKVQKKAVKGSVEVTVTATPTMTVPVPAGASPAAVPSGAATGATTSAGNAAPAGTATPSGGATPAGASGAARS